jgi:RecA-family ATPase
MSFAAYTIDELLRLKPPSWLIEGIIPEGGLTALYGNPGDGKSFIALDMALAIASGRPWQGHPTKKGYVVYISAEGGGGIGKRVGAWLTHAEIKPKDYRQFLTNFITAAIRIHPDSEDLGAVLSETFDHPDYQEALGDVLDAEEPRPPLFIVVDTLARCFEGDENQQEDMGNFIKGLDTLRETHDATILVVHHTGKHGIEERGSSAFRGACDMMMLVERNEDNALSLSCTKQKDYEQFPTEAFELIVVPKWDSCVLQSVRLRTDQERMRVAVYLDQHPEATIREIAHDLHLSKSSIERRLKELRKATLQAQKIRNSGTSS